MSTVVVASQYHQPNFLDVITRPGIWSTEVLEMEPISKIQAEYIEELRRSGASLKIYGRDKEGLKTRVKNDPNTARIW